MHHVVVALHRGRSHHFMLCSHRAEENLCKGHQNFEAGPTAGSITFLEKGIPSSCALLEHLWTMEDFGAFREGEEIVPLLTWQGRAEVGSFIEEEDGPDTLVMQAHGEVLELRVNGEWARSVGFTGEGMVVIPVAWAWNQEREEPTWQFSGPHRYLKSTDAEWHELMRGRNLSPVASAQEWIENILGKSSAYATPTEAAEEWLSEGKDDGPEEWLALLEDY